jgi:hypothetical protein
MNAAKEILNGAAKKLEDHKSGITAEDINLFVKIMQDIATRPENDAKVGKEAGFQAWKDDFREALKKDMSAGFGAVDDASITKSMNKFQTISAEIQKKAKDYFGSALGRKYSDDTKFGARSFRVVQLLPRDYKVDEGQSK